MSLVLNVEILGEFKKLTEATKGAQGTLEGLGTKFATIGKNIGKVALGIGAAVGAGIATQIKPAIDAASDLGESINAVNVAFGESADAVLKLGQSSARGLGLSKNELFGIATQFSAFAKTIAGDGGDAAKVIDDISKRGADFASVFNLDVSEALEKFQSGLAGQSEPLRKYGIDLSAATVEQYALENGIWDGTGAMTEQEKVLARYGAIMEQTNMVAGDFANTSDSLANQQRILQATFTDLQAEIGQQFLPILNDLLGFILDEIIPAVQDFWADFTDPSGEAQAQIGALGEAWRVFTGQFVAGAGEMGSAPGFKTLGDTLVSIMRMLTNFSVFASETMAGIVKIFQAGVGLGPTSQALRGAGIAQVGGALATANAASSRIRFADELPSTRATPQNFRTPDQYISNTVVINRAAVNADEVAKALNDKLKAQGSGLRIQ